MKWIIQLYKKFFCKKDEVQENTLEYTFYGLNPEIIRAAMYRHGTGEKYGKEWILIWWDNFLYQRTPEHYRGPLSEFLQRRQDLRDHINFGNYITQQEEETMNDNLNTTVTNADMAEAAKVGLTQDEFAKLLATKPVDGEVVGPIDDTYYVTDANETTDEATPTVH